MLGEMRNICLAGKLCKGVICTHLTHHVVPLSDRSPPPSPNAPSCMHNCQGTLQAILQELRTMRRLMQTQQGKYVHSKYTNTNAHKITTKRTSPGPSSDGHPFPASFAVKLEQTASPRQQFFIPSPAPHHRARKWRPLFKMAPPNAPSRRAAIPAALGSPSCVAPTPPVIPQHSGHGEGQKTEEGSDPTGMNKRPVQNISIAANNQHTPLLSQSSGRPQPKEVLLHLTLLIKIVCLQCIWAH